MVASLLQEGACLPPPRIELTNQQAPGLDNHDLYMTTTESRIIAKELGQAKSQHASGEFHASPVATCHNSKDLYCNGFHSTSTIHYNELSMHFFIVNDLGNAWNYRHSGSGGTGDGVTYSSDQATTSTHIYLGVLRGDGYHNYYSSGDSAGNSLEQCPDECTYRKHPPDKLQSLNQPYTNVTVNSYPYYASYISNLGYNTLHCLPVSPPGQSPNDQKHPFYHDDTTSLATSPSHQAITSFPSSIIHAGNRSLRGDNFPHTSSRTAGNLNQTRFSINTLGECTCTRGCKPGQGCRSGTEMGGSWIICF